MTKPVLFAMTELDASKAGWHRRLQHVEVSVRWWGTPGQLCAYRLGQWVKGCWGRKGLVSSNFSEVCDFSFSGGSYGEYRKWKGQDIEPLVFDRALVTSRSPGRWHQALVTLSQKTKYPSGKHGICHVDGPMCPLNPIDHDTYMGMGQNLLYITYYYHIRGGWISIYQLFGCSLGSRHWGSAEKAGAPRCEMLVGLHKNELARYN